MKPNILLSTNRSSTKTLYINSVKDCGGKPDDFYCHEIDTNYDGLILCGGADIHPKFYGQEIRGAENIDENRDECELQLAKAYIEIGKPVFGICRGLQLLNVLFGGTLIQHLSKVDNHRNDDKNGVFHKVKAEKGSIVNDLYGNEFAVNSFHHQGIHKIGQDLRITAYSDDGVIEAFEHKSLPVFAVQWHPERIFDMGDNETASGKDIFTYFLNLCGK